MANFSSTRTTSHPSQLVARGGNTEATLHLPECPQVAERSRQSGWGRGRRRCRELGLILVLHSFTLPFIYSFMGAFTRLLTYTTFFQTHLLEHPVFPSPTRISPCIQTIIDDIPTRLQPLVGCKLPREAGVHSGVKPALTQCPAP